MIVLENTPATVEPLVNSKLDGASQPELMDTANPINVQDFSAEKNKLQQIRSILANNKKLSKKIRKASRPRWRQ